MNDASATHLDACGISDSASTVWPRALLDRQLLLLDRLAEAGVELALIATAEAKRAEADVPAMTRSHARAARAARQAVLLQSRLIKDFQAHETLAGQALAGAKAAEDKVREERQNTRKAHASLIIERIAKAQHDDRETVDRLTYEADERLDDDGLLGDVLTRPISEIVAQICKDLGLQPDWPRLAEEGWAKEEMASGEARWPFHPTSPTRSVAGGGPPAEERVVEGEGGWQYPASSPFIRNSS